jgi:hypothetical protein
VISLVLAVAVVAATALSCIHLGYHRATGAFASVALALVIPGVVIAIDTGKTVVAREEMVRE